MAKKKQFEMSGSDSVRYILNLSESDIYKILPEFDRMPETDAGNTVRFLTLCCLFDYHENMRYMHVFIERYVAAWFTHMDAEIAREAKGSKNGNAK
ncbi:MAG: hypothetical protein Ta2A_10370 [Treponemataceae bacterium]|nr:MAG: hypothetical protein Ta2A_10370 [Treponemataceae bacterium]